MGSKFILTIDQGTTSTRATLFSENADKIACTQIPLACYFPNLGWVEQNPEEIWQSTIDCCRQVIAKAKIDINSILTLGISNQRETTIIWEKTTGKPIYNAIVWQDRRTLQSCKSYIAKSLQPLIQQKTGLLIDPYFSATKIAWILDNNPEARKRSEAGELCFGTVDSFLLWRLTGGKSHYTDVTNAARTLLFNIHNQQWDEELLGIFSVPVTILPEVRPNCTDFGQTDLSILGKSLPIQGMIGDQQAALVGQACFQPGMVKSTFGTGCFMLMNTGTHVVNSTNNLLSTPAYQTIDTKMTYSLEGSIFIAGAVIQWLRDKLKIIQSASECEAIAAQIHDNEGVYLVPAFTGLGAPYWEPETKGAIFGLTRNTGISHIVRAALESVAYQARDLLDCMKAEQLKPICLRVDGGMANNQWLMQFLADILQLPVQKPTLVETTSLGAAFIAGLTAGIFKGYEHITQLWQSDSTFHPTMKKEQSEALYAGWQDAVAKVIKEDKQTQ